MGGKERFASLKTQIEGRFVDTRNVAHFDTCANGKLPYIP
jgi:hypothetical protein